jgi:hypothetical protein
LLQQEMLSSSGVWNYRKAFELPIALRNEMRMRVFHHIVGAMQAAAGVVTSEARTTKPRSKYRVQLVFGKMAVKFRYIDAPLATPSSRRLLPIARSKSLFLTHPVTDPADSAKGKRRQRGKTTGAVGHERSPELVEIGD